MPIPLTTSNRAGWRVQHCSGCSTEYPQLSTARPPLRVIHAMRPFLAFLSVFLLTGCEDFQQATEATETTSKVPRILTPSSILPSWTASRGSEPQLLDSERPATGSKWPGETVTTSQK